LAFALYVHGHIPMFQQIAFSRHAYLIASQWERSRQTATVAPPRHGKTKLMQWEMEMWIGMETEKCHALDGKGNLLYPGHPVPTCLYVMNTAEQAEKECQLIEHTLEYNRRYRGLFPHVKPAKKFGWTKGHFFLARSTPRDTPTFQATGMFGPVQGAGFGKMGMDDGTDQQDAASPALIDRQKEFRFGVFADRMDEWHGQVRDILTRWHLNDMFSVLEDMPTVDCLVMPALGFWEAHPEHGITEKALWPEVWPEERPEEKRLEKVSAGQAGLWQLTYMCDPVVAEGAMFKRDWLKDIHASPPEGLIVVQAVDPAIGMTKRADSTVIATVGLDLKARRFHVLDIYHDQLEGPDQPAAIAKQYEKWQPYTVGIESIFYQAALFQTVYREGSTRVSKIERRSGAGGIPKMMRMMGLAVRYKEQQVIHPISAPWLEDYEVELMSIQYIDGKGIHKHEDRADAVEMCIQLLSPLITTGATPQEPIYSDVTVRT
ncbi:MAG TPA: hypothetical protein VFD42_07430, partial [Chloroflexota bacterium]|nr:hypothetical protein [Chloroflexota bacterium]